MALVEPLASPSPLARYTAAIDSFMTAANRMERSIATNNNATRSVTTFSMNNTLVPELAVYDEDLSLLHHIQLAGNQYASGAATEAAFLPARPGLLYAVNVRPVTGAGITYFPALEEVDLALGRQVRSLTWNAYPNQVPVPDALALADDGGWAYMLIHPMGEMAPTRLLAVRLDTPGPADYAAPLSQLALLPARQEHTWWAVAWSGEDDGSGIDRYEVQYRVGTSETWLPWQDTPQTGSLFRGALLGETYQFRVRAYDRAGNIESWLLKQPSTTVAGADENGLYTTYLPMLK